MDTQALSTKKRVPVAQIRPGMYVVGLDRSWFRTPFLFHRRFIRSAEEVELLKKHGIREVVIDTARGADVETPEAARFAPALQEVTAKNEREPKAHPTLRSTSPSETAFRPLVKELHVATRIHDAALSTAQRVFEGVGSGAPVSSPAVKKAVTDLLSSITRSPEANLMLAQLRRFQNDLFTHSVNVCVLSLVVGQIEGLQPDISALGLGALLHDIGQVRLPGNLLRKTDPYTEAERRLMENHPKLGAIIVAQSDDIPEPARRIVMDHHERIDGSGYPSGVRGAQISLFSQVVAITDVYDAMLTGRNHRALQPIEVLRQLYLQGNAGAFDCNLIERVIRCLGVYPVGSLVELNTGERGIVIGANRSDSLKPTLRVISSRDGLPLSDGQIISLADTSSGSVDRRIVRALDPGKERVDLMFYLKLAPAMVG
jgi:HD-GYP domain-containing protein (c-di-GMP phosphodiesterase class II)